MSQLNIGDRAPGFTLLDQNENSVSLSDYRGRKLLVYFYPRANTPGCTTQSCAVSESLPNLEDLGVAAVGISPDKPAAQKKFDEKYTLNFPLLSDPDLNTARAFGAFGIKNMFGKKKAGIIRSAFLIDEKGNLLGVWYKVKPNATVPNALAALE